MTQLTDLTVRYGDHTVIEHLSYTFPQKGIFLLMGPSGLGKTTLLRLLAGIESPTEGHVESDHTRCSVSFQEPRLLPWLNALENLTFVLPDGEESKALAVRTLDALELSDAIHLLPGALSGGMAGRVSLARALAYGGDLLLLDEPFSALDPALKARIAPLVRAANPDGLTLVISHDPEDAKLLGARILRCEGAPFSSIREV